MFGWYSLIRMRNQTAVMLTLLGVGLARAAGPVAELPSPVLNTVFPAGGKVGTSISVTVDGTGLDGLESLRFAESRITCKKGEGQQLTLTIPADLAPGVYDVRTVSKLGMSGPRAFFISNRPEVVETASNDTLESAESVPIDNVVNGRLDKPGDIDCYRFTARAGQRVVLDFWAERLDSKLRGVLEVYDAKGKRLSVSRGHGTTMDPLVDFLVPADGTYVVKLFDQTFAGSDAHFYRLDIDTGPRPEFTFPAVVPPGKKSKVTLYGRNLPGARRDPMEVAGGAGAQPVRQVGGPLPLDSIEIEVTPPDSPVAAGVPLLPAQVAVDAFPYYVLGGHAPVLIGVTDLPIVRSSPSNQRVDEAQLLAVPSEVSGQLIQGDQRDYYSFDAREGEVLWLEAFGSRIGSPVDLDLVVFDDQMHELLRLSDCLVNLAHMRFPTNHTDPGGRFVAPHDGHYFVMVRNLLGGLDDDPSRVYRLSARREQLDFHLAVIPRGPELSTGFNVARGGKEMLEVVALRHRGMSAPIRVTTGNLPPGIHCEDVWIGPGADRAPLVVTVDPHAPDFFGALNLMADSVRGTKIVMRSARGGAIVWPAQPTGWGRLTDEVPLAVAPDARLVVNVTPWEPKVFDYGTTRIFQGSTIDLAVDIERRDSGAGAPVRLKGVGLPPGMVCETTPIPAGKSKGWVSFSIPSSLPPGPYTIAVQADTEVPNGDKPASLATFSNPVTIQVEPERIRLEIDVLAPRKIARGKQVKIPVRIERKNGFIGKVLGELIAPGGINGLQARGLAFESQLEAANIDVVAADAAPLGRHALLRVELVGMWEDKAVCRATGFVDLEITE